MKPNSSVISDKELKLFNSTYEKYKNKIEKILYSALEKRIPQSIYAPSSYILKSPGKRIRPLLVLFANKAVGGNVEKSYNAAVSVEILHNFTLVHDDIMDNADKRRGMPTIHKKYDISTAILVGDVLMAVAYEYLLKDVTSNVKEIIKVFNNGIVEVCEGQSYDKDFEIRQTVSIDEYILMITKKTAALAEMCCRIGALLGGASKEEVKILSDYGKNLGIAFQIQDDLLDLIADEKDFGKSVGIDLVEGKKSFLFLKAYELAKGNDKKLLDNLIMNKGISNADVPTYKEIYERLGILDLSKKEVAKYSEKATKNLHKLKNQKDVVLLYTLVSILLKRSK